jgi:hypothetical protein
MAFWRCVTVAALAVALAAPVAAQSIRDDVEAALVAQGYEIVNVGRTWLGRLRVVAENDEIRREIVINPSTGEVLRDYSVALANLGRPLFPGEDNNPDRSAPATARMAADAPAAESTEVEATGDATLGAEGAVEAPPLTVDD